MLNSDYLEVETESDDKSNVESTVNIEEYQRRTINFNQSKIKSKEAAICELLESKEANKFIETSKLN